MTIRDVNFPASAREISISHDLTESDILEMRLRYLGHSYNAMSRFSRGSVLIQNAQIVTKEMVNAFLAEK